MYLKCSSSGSQDASELYQQFPGMFACMKIPPFIGLYSSGQILEGGIKNLGEKFPDCLVQNASELFVASF